MIGRGVESKSGGSVCPFEGAREFDGKHPTTLPWSRVDGVTLVNQETKSERNRVATKTVRETETNWARKEERE